MIKGLLGKKIGMTQVFKDTGELIPVTVIEAGPCHVLQIKPANSKGIYAVQLCFDKKNEKHVNKPDMNNFKKANVAPCRFVKEVAADDVSDLKPADAIMVDMFQKGEYVDITGTSIGKGFQGGVKRWHWKSGPRTHGSTSHRAPGSIGSSTTPGRVIKGHHLPGHMGNAKATVQNLEIVDVDKEKNMLVVKGAVPGYEGNYLIINKSFKKFKKEAKPVVAKKKEKDALKESKNSMKKIVKEKE